MLTHVVEEERVQRAGHIAEVVLGKLEVDFLDGGVEARQNVQISATQIKFIHSFNQTNEQRNMHVTLVSITDTALTPTSTETNTDLLAMKGEESTSR